MSCAKSRSYFVYFFYVVEPKRRAADQKQEHLINCNNEFETVLLLFLFTS
jgi:hypothetical protein